MKKLVHKILLLLLMTTALSSCMAGGTAGTGLGYGGAVKRSNDGIMYASVTGVAISPNGKAASNITIHAESSKAKEESTTDAVGSFGILLVAAPGEEIRFTFKDRSGKKWTGKFSSWSLRDGDQLSVKLLSDGQAKIEMYY